ncbi:hypothetical protein EDD16DRAFT_1528731 [Pisolithus croceorrhizus]|nr:hypothetical protein EDD16DRAFT_1528731 [Pisolithus croceorrhizus]
MSFGSTSFLEVAHHWCKPISPLNQHTKQVLTMTLDASLDPPMLAAIGADRYDVVFTSFPLLGTEETGSFVVAGFFGPLLDVVRTTCHGHLDGGGGAEKTIVAQHSKHLAISSATPLAALQSTHHHCTLVLGHGHASTHLYAGSLRGQQTNGLVAMAFLRECVYHKDGKATQALSKKLGDRRRASPRNTYEMYQLYSAGALRVRCVELHWMHSSDWNARTPPLINTMKVMAMGSAIATSRSQQTLFIATTLRNSSIQALPPDPEGLLADNGKNQERDEEWGSGFNRRKQSRQAPNQTYPWSKQGYVEPSGASGRESRRTWRSFVGEAWEDEWVDAPHILVHAGSTVEPGKPLVQKNAHIGFLFTPLTDPTGRALHRLPKPLPIEPDPLRTQVFKARTQEPSKGVTVAGAHAAREKIARICRGIRVGFPVAQRSGRDGTEYFERNSWNVDYVLPVGQLAKGSRMGERKVRVSLHPIGAVTGLWSFILKVAIIYETEVK